jgi:hypothetical protein
VTAAYDGAAASSRRCYAHFVPSDMRAILDLLLGIFFYKAFHFSSDIKRWLKYAIVMHHAVHFMCLSIEDQQKNTPGKLLI